jgi:hypothetical protein
LTCQHLRALVSVRCCGLASWRLADWPTADCGQTVAVEQLAPDCYRSMMLLKQWNRNTHCRTGSQDGGGLMHHNITTCAAALKKPSEQCGGGALREMCIRGSGQTAQWSQRHAMSGSDSLSAKAASKSGRTAGSSCANAQCRARGRSTCNVPRCLPSSLPLLASPAATSRSSRSS